MTTALVTLAVLVVFVAGFIAGVATLAWGLFGPVPDPYGEDDE